MYKWTSDVNAAWNHKSHYAWLEATSRNSLSVWELPKHVYILLFITTNRGSRFSWLKKTKQKKKEWLFACFRVHQGWETHSYEGRARFSSYQVVNPHHLVGRKTRLDQDPRRKGLLIPDKEPNKGTVRCCDSFLKHSSRTLKECWGPKQKHLHGAQCFFFSLFK